jgi:hypothetical protein
MLRSTQLREAIQDSSQRLGIPRRYDLGVLLVHGLGEQARGDTLTVQGDPIVAWLRARIGATGEPDAPRVDVLDVVARQTSRDAIPDPHAVVRITPAATAEPPEEPAYWLVAEAYWAENFRQATFAEFIGWWLTIGPWIFATQVAGIVRRMEIGVDVPAWLRVGLMPITILSGAVFALVAAGLSFLASIAAAVVVVLAFTRIPVIADVASGFQKTLANGFGDAYVLSRSPVRFGAMSSEVRAALDVLRQECDAVAVIAESQGTAVAWYGMKHEIVDPLTEFQDGGQRQTDPDLGPAPIGLFLTHAQGLRKLTFALTMARRGQTPIQHAAAIASAGLVGVAAVILLFGLPWYLAAAAALLALVAEVVLLISANAVWEEAGRDIERDWNGVLKAEARSRSDPRQPRLEWLDLWASADPGSVGPLDVEGERINSFKIRNLGSLWADHVAYWRNTTEFLPIVTARLFHLGGPPEYGMELDDPRLEVPAMRRHARVLALVPYRAVVGFGVAIGLLHAAQSPDFGSGVVEFIGSLNLPFIDGFFDQPPEWVVAIAGYVAVLVFGLVLWQPAILFWNALMRRDERTFFRGFARPLWSPAWYAFGLGTLPLAAIVVALLLAGERPLLAVVYVVGLPFLALLGIVVVAGGGRTYGSEEALERPMAAAARITGSPRSSLVVIAVMTAAIVVIPLLTAVVLPDAFGAVLVAETALLSAILAIEGWREYRIFRERFVSQNRKLPVEPPRQERAAVAN